MSLFAEAVSCSDPRQSWDELCLWVLMCVREGKKTAGHRQRKLPFSCILCAVLLSSLSVYPSAASRETKPVCVSASQKKKNSQNWSHQQRKASRQHLRWLIERKDELRGWKNNEYARKEGKSVPLHFLVNLLYWLTLYLESRPAESTGLFAEIEQYICFALSVWILRYIFCR